MIKVMASITPTLNRIVRAIEKGAGEDLKKLLFAMNNETNNAAPMLRADLINSNLRNLVISEDPSLELLHFSRSGWTGSLLIDRVHKLTFSICTEQTLVNIGSKTRQVPHYLQSILHVQNADVIAKESQPYLFDGMPEIIFSDDEYQRDYDRIMGGEIQVGDGYKHWVIVYSTSHFSVISIKMLELDEYLQIGTEYSLDDMLALNFEDLTYDEGTETATKDVRSLISVKPNLSVKSEDGIKPEVVVPRTNEGEMHA